MTQVIFYAAQCIREGGGVGGAWGVGAREGTDINRKKK